MNFYDILAAEKWGGGIPTINFFDLLFAQPISGEQWQVYEGTLPATINANGSDMRQYQIWGNTGGVGDRTVQLFDKNATDTTNGYVSGGYLAANGEITSNGDWSISEYIEIDQNKNYVLNNLRADAAYCLYDNAKDYISGTRYNNKSTITFNSEDAKYIRFSVVKKSTLPLYNLDILTFTEGSTPPETFVPFGYEVDMGVKSGNLFNENTTYENGYYTSEGTFTYSNGVITYDYFPVEALKEYFYKAFYAIPSSAESERTIRVNFFDSQKSFISRFLDVGTALSIKNVTTPQNCAFVRLSVNKILSNIFFGTTPPDEYQPYSDTTIPIYIGDKPLDKDEYVDYQAGKVFRRTENEFDVNKVNKNMYLGPGGSTGTSDVTDTSDYIYIKNFNYGLLKSLKTGDPLNTNVRVFCFYDSQKNFLGRDSSLTYEPSNITDGVTISIPNNAEYVRFSYDKRYSDEVMFILSDSAITPPETYIPYLQPTDPPVPLPALPTCEGETVVDYAGESVARPEKVLLEYAKGGN